MRTRHLVPLVAALALGASMLPGTATARSTPHGRFLPGPLNGKAAVQALGDRLGAAAAKTDRTGSELKRLLLEDSSVWIASSGQTFFVDRASPTIATGSAGAVASPTYPLSESFTLHSNPASTRKIFLDFDGGSITNTWWNDSTHGRGVPNGTHVGFSLDSDYASFSPDERAFIQDVWRQVSEIYSPFNVDVTTEDPGPDGVNRASSEDQAYGQQVMISDDPALRSKACGTCAGMAVDGQFGNATGPAGYYQPALVFSYDDGLSPSIIAQSAAHEVGHTLGLKHDGKGSSPYYMDFTPWAPIMGASFDRSISQWSKGEYAGADNTEDDLALMQAAGLPLRQDDHGDTTGTAEQLGDHATYAASGVISTRQDVDVFALDVSCSGNLAVRADGIGSQSTLDIKLTVTPPVGTPTVVDPAFGEGSNHVATGMTAAATVPASPGRYYVAVDGTGSGNPADGTGYTDYASLGQYSLNVTACGDGGPGTTDPDPPARTAPQAPEVGRASSGARRRPITATVRWTAPADNGGAAVTNYQIRAEKLGRRSRVTRVYTITGVDATVTTATVGLPRGKYRFFVLAVNAVGSSPWSSPSRTVRAR